jgi:hypothetical protein
MSNSYVNTFVHRRSHRAPQNASGEAARKLAHIVITPPSFYLPFLSKKYTDDALGSFTGGYPLPTIYVEDASPCFVMSFHVTMTGSPGSVIHYTIDGSTPTVLSPVYSARIRITGVRDWVIQAIQTDGVQISGVSSVRVTCCVWNTPTISIPGGGNIITGPTLVTISCPGSTNIYYSIDGSLPTIPYTEPITISASTLVRARATKTGYVEAPGASQTYTLALVNIFYGGNVNTTITEGEIVALGGTSTNTNPGLPTDYTLGPFDPIAYGYFVWKDSLIPQPIAISGFQGPVGYNMTIDDLASGGDYYHIENGYPYALVAVSGVNYRVYRTKFRLGFAVTFRVTAA